MPINRGSEWRKWDLHIHSPCSHMTSNRYGDASIENFCDKIIAENLAVIGLTNYFYIEEVEFNSIQKRLGNKCAVIPNIEFRASAKNNRGDHINFHVLFNPDNLSLERITKCISSIPMADDSTRHCCAEDINEVGFASVSVNFLEVVKKLKNDFKEFDDFLIALPYTGHGGFKPKTKPSTIKAGLMFDKSSHLIYGNRQCVDVFKAPRSYDLGKEKGFVKRLKPVIDCSDAHDLSVIGGKFTWVKADPNFEGLKQVVFEPLERSRIQQGKPDTKDPKMLLSSVRFVGTSKVFSNEPIYLNENLNVIIGGYSSGKSLLLNHIAKTLEVLGEFNNRGVDGKAQDQIYPEYSFEGKEYDGFDFEVTSAQGVTALLGGRDKHASIIPKVKYIPQAYLSKLAKPAVSRTGRNLLTLVRELLLEDGPCEKTYYDFISTVKALDIERNSKVEAYFNLGAEIRGLRKKLEDLGDERVVLASIKEAEKQIVKLKSSAGLGVEEQSKYDELRVNLQKEESQLNTLYSESRLIADLCQTMHETLDGLKADVEQVRNKLESPASLNFFDGQFAWVSEQAEKLKDLAGDTYKSTSDLSIDAHGLRAQIDIHLEKVKSFKELLSPLLKSKKIEREIEAFQKLLKLEKKKQLEIVRTREEISTARKQIGKLRTEILDSFEESYKCYPKVIAELQGRASSLGIEQLEILGSTKFNQSKFLKKAMAFLDGRNQSTLAIFPTLMERRYDSNSRVIDLIDVEFKVLQAELGMLFDHIIEGQVRLKGGTTKEQACKLIFGHPSDGDYFVEFWQVKYRGDVMGKMSLGKASFVILLLIVGLSNSKAPILIDQPEDNLDNRSISTELVDFIKSKKKDRQIILVTHNPNVVVNADAENVIVANQNGQGGGNSGEYKFAFVNGAIENSFKKTVAETEILKSMGIREHIADIVEGGEDAFRKREEKYGFHSAS